MKRQKLENLLDEMWRDYLNLNPEVRGIYELFQAVGENVVNDHIALRTFNLEKTNIKRLAKPFKDCGYEKKDTYHFKGKKLYAEHFEHREAHWPKIFISELLVGEFSEKTQEIIEKLVSQMDEGITKADHFVCSGRPWDLDSETYKKLLEVSEYAAWVAAFGFRPNHFTISVNALKSFDDVEDVNKFLKAKGIPLNTSGGEVKGSKEARLKQSSTLANLVSVDFSDKTIEIPGCYYEFAKRFTLPNGKLYQGFVTSSADKIFESTDQKERKKG
ncbi:MAG: DUF1338 domain-containing protein [Bacteriovoracales bacterium]|nr:DUF1338 domain-containing protein [Bacteriovoracales bacterium]